MALSMKASLSIVLAAVLARAGAAVAAEPSGVAPEAPAARPYRVAAALYRYVVPDEPDFFMLVAPADFGRLHVEGRYNYEGLQVGSAFVGVTGHAGSAVRASGTAMLGAVFGNVHGVAPGARVTVAWWRLDLLSEAQYVFDLGDLSASFFYCWTEVGVSPLRWLRFAVIGQRTHIVHNALDVQRGLSVGVTLFGKVTLTAYELNLGWIEPTYIGAVGVAF
jgi:hypothetical protein